MEHATEVWLGVSGSSLSVLSLFVFFVTVGISYSLHISDPSDFRKGRTWERHWQHSTSYGVKRVVAYAEYLFN